MMFRKLFLALLLTGTFTLSLSAQTTDDQARDDLDYYSSSDAPRSRADDSFGSNLWWGTGAQLGFQGGNNSSFFQIGLSPILGYKVNNFLSFGPRGSIAYNNFRFDNFNGTTDRFNFVTWSGGLFARGQVFQQFFVHAEYSLVNEVLSFVGNEAVRTTRAIPFLGGGISQGGGPGALGFEIMVLFRLSQPDQIGDAPFEIRTGINFNF